MLWVSSFGIYSMYLGDGAWGYRPIGCNVEAPRELHESETFTVTPNLGFLLS